MLKLAIDFGTCTTKIYQLGSGIVLSEATCVAVGEGGKVRALGDEAKRMLGKTAELTDIRFPVYEGEIVSEEYASVLLDYFLDKVTGGKRAEALFCVPCATPQKEIEKYARIARNVGISKVHFAEVPYLSVLGQDTPVSESNPVFCIDIGGGCTSVSAFSLDGMIAGFSMNVGGNNMDVHIIDHIAGQFNLKIGTLTSEKLKASVASFLDYDNRTMIVNGRDTETGKPRAVSVSSSDILLPVKIYVDKIVEYSEMVLKKLPAEVSATVARNGVYLSGGTAKIAGLADYIAKELQLEVHLAEEPQMAVILGGGRALGNSAILKKIER